MSPAHPELPLKVRERLLHYNNVGEVLARLLQIGIVVIFGVLYASAPRTDAATPFHPVPYVLAAYVGFSTLVLIAALRSRLPDIAVYMTIVVDVTLLMALI